MCLDTDSIEKLHAASTRLRELHEARNAWRSLFNRENDPPQASSVAPLIVSEDEGERIFHSRIVAMEASLDELGWRRTIRVESEKRQVSEAETV